MSKSSICLLNTRPEHQAQPLDALLKANGFETLSCPALEIISHPLSTSQKQTLDDLIHPQLFDAIFITSVNALIGWVNQFPEYFLKNGAPFQPAKKETGRLDFDLDGVALMENLKCPVFAIGEATAKAARKLGLQVQMFPRKQFVSEDLIHQLFEESEQFASASVEPKRIAVFSGVGGRDVIKTQLMKHGAEVVEFELYRRQAAVFCNQAWQAFIKSSQPVILVSSLESWQSLYGLLVEWNADYQNFNSAVWQPIEKFLVFSERIKRAMVDQGISQAKISVTPIQSNQGILQSLRCM